MTAEPFKRKLTAILSADVKGYSRLMGEDEEGTIRTLNAYLDVITGFIHQHRGRLVATGGDSVLAEFPSVVDAVRCAVEIQEELKDRNKELGEAKRMEFRIGINLGDVVEEGDNILGDGVNVAARVQSLAEAGGICISGTVYDQVKDKLTLRYDYLGKQTVKNIAEPLRVYRVLMEPLTSAARMLVWKRRGLSHWKRIHPLFKILIALFAAASAVWPLYTHYVTRPVASLAKSVAVASKEKMAFPLPDKPSIAVLPFTNMSNDKEQEYFADGLAEEIINALSKLSNVFVIARNSTFTYKGKPVKVQQVAEELGVQYVLEGSVRKMGDKVRITAQLVDALTGNHLMSEQYERDLKDIFAVQDDVTMKVLTSLRVNLTEGESARAFGRGTRNLEAYLKLLQAYEQRAIWNKESQARARQLAEEAITLDPGYALAYSYLALALVGEVNLGVYDNPQKVLERAYGLAEKAVALDDSSAWSHIALGTLSVLYKKDWDKDIAEAQRAVAVEPGSAYSYGSMAMSLTFAGRYEDAIPYYKKAFRLSPRPLPLWLMNLAVCYTAMGQYEEAIRILKSITEKQPDQAVAHILLAVAYVLSGREDDARKEAAEILRIDPTFSLDRAQGDLFYKDHAELGHMREAALRKAGLK
ncbi:MAG TPA: adenylate/guanylate cyclase domain-containing protein [Syntrophorhabdales bacterium]|nr:adenylate/guanylate cyclase domain-containing protein [Syntrophorhabdales bacterium]